MRRTPALLVCGALWLSTGCDIRLVYGRLAEAGADPGAGSDAGGDRDASADGSTGVDADAAMDGDAGGDGDAGRGGSGDDASPGVDDAGHEPAPLCPRKLSAPTYTDPTFRCELVPASYAMCSCGSVQSSALLTLDAFDSAVSAYRPGASGGSLGVHGGFYPFEARVGGSLVVLGTDGTPLMGDLHVTGDLHVAGQLDGPFAVHVGASAQVLGNLHVQRMSVGGALAVGADTSVIVAEGAPSFTRDATPPAPPCACDPKLDVAGLIAAHRDDNDNAHIGLDPQHGLKALDGALELSLPCGRYYVDAFYAAHPITLTVLGPVELYVNDAMVADGAGSIDIQLAPEGQLDLFLKDGTATKNHVAIGTHAAPPRTRIFSGQGSTLYFGGNTTLGALLYAPQSNLVTGGTFEVFGAVAVGSASSSAPVRVHLDHALERCP